MNYLYPKDGTIHFRRPVVTEITDNISQEFQEWNIDEYLPNETIQWISQALEVIDIDLSTVRGSNLLEDGSRLHLQVYCQVRELVQLHVISGQEPLLSETPQPLGGYNDVEQRGGYLASVLRDNCEYWDSYEAKPIQELVLAPDFQDIEDNRDWANGIEHGVVQQDEVL